MVSIHGLFMTVYNRTSSLICSQGPRAKLLVDPVFHFAIVNAPERHLLDASLEFLLHCFPDKRFFLKATFSFFPNA